MHHRYELSSSWAAAPTALRTGDLRIRWLAARLRRVAVVLRVAGGGIAVGVSVSTRLLLPVACACRLHEPHARGSGHMRVWLRSAPKTHVSRAEQQFYNAPP